MCDSETDSRRLRRQQTLGFKSEVRERNSCLYYSNSR